MPQIVQAELVWVLESAYHFDKTAVVTVLKHLQQSPVFTLQHKTQFNTALMHFKDQQADFSDCLILSTCLENKHQLFTFDKKLARLESVNLLQESSAF